jgi:hypothetical protein
MASPGPIVVQYAPHGRTGLPRTGIKGTLRREPSHFRELPEARSTGRAGAGETSAVQFSVLRIFGCGPAAGENLGNVGQKCGSERDGMMIDSHSFPAHSYC